MRFQIILLSIHFLRILNFKWFLYSLPFFFVIQFQENCCQIEKCSKSLQTILSDKTKHNITEWLIRWMSAIARELQQILHRVECQSIYFVPSYACIMHNTMHANDAFSYDVNITGRNTVTIQLQISAFDFQINS